MRILLSAVIAIWFVKALAKMFIDWLVHDAFHPHKKQELKHE